MAYQRAAGDGGIALRLQIEHAGSPRLSTSVGRVATLACARARGYSFAMPTVILKAHYDGERIVLDEPFDRPTDSTLMVTVLPKEDSLLSRERAQWADLAAQSLARAYGDDEPEYSLADIKERP